jgi:selenide, water dikinase
VHVIKMLGMPAGRKLVLEQGIRVTLIARDVHTPYSGMLPGFVAGHYTMEDIHLDLEKLCRFSNIRLIHASARSISYGNVKEIECDDGRPPVRYDALSIDVGSAPSGTPPSHVIPVKPIAHFAARYMQLQDIMKRSTQLYSASNPFRVLVVGGGAGGIELACAVQYNLQCILERQGISKDAVKLVIATRGGSLLEQHNGNVRKIFRRIVAERNIEILYNTEVTDIELLESGKKVTVTNAGTPIQFDECLWCTNACAPDWISQNTPFATTSEGFLRVHTTYECIHHPGVFAAGDCCHMDQYPRPKAGVFAVRAGPPLLENVLNYLTSRRLVSHKPQRHFLGIISTGDQYAIASKGNWFALEGKLVWKLKDYIDRTWMAKYIELPDVEKMMEQMHLKISKSIPDAVRQKGPEVLAAFAADSMRCGGCGAKVGATTVSRVLKAIYQRQLKRAKLFNLSDPHAIDHDDAAVVPVPKGVVATINTIDYFRSFVSDPFVFGKVAAVHALSDIHAMGAKAQTALALAVVPFAADENITESTLLELLSGASDVFQDENVQIVGGHTCEGSELACGFAIQGYTGSPERLLRKRGGRVGDKIVLTKPIGTGALFAADMRAKCKGDFVVEALQSMIVSNVQASDIAARTKGVHSCTDVTGFGLAGHLLEMLVAEQEKQIGADLQIHDIPFLPGGIEASRNKIFSSLQRDNIRNGRAVSNHADVAAACPIEYPLIFDPQTAGGLLFFVDRESCPGFVNELRELYPATSVIGDVVEYVDLPVGVNDVCTVGSGGRRIGLRLKVEFALKDGIATSLA